MKKDILVKKVEDLVVAVVPQLDDPDFWDVFLLNLKEKPIRFVLVNSKGYGTVDGEERKTSTLRHFFEEIGPMQVVQIEPIQASLFDLAHEYWVSFLFENYLYDKKYVFVRGSIHADYFTMVPFVNRKGVMIR